VGERPTIHDVARRAGVSIATVSRALNGHADVSLRTRDAVVAAARELGYATSRARLVAVLVGDNAGHRDLSLVFFGKVLAAISRRLGQSGYEPVLLQVDGESVTLDVGAHVAAAIVIGVDADASPLAELAARQIPVVGVDVPAKGRTSAFVGSDHAGGVMLAVGHLHALGHRRIAHIAGAGNTAAGAARLAAFRREVERLELDPGAEYVRDGDFTSASGYREACALLALRERPTAIVAASDLMALAALQAIWDAGLEPGGDVAVVGFDDLEAAALAHPPLTTIRQDRAGLGELAAARAIELVETGRVAERATTLPVELVVRASSGSARAAVAAL
jgi:LacI family transcriptional regulator, galactose operon repressor